MKSASDYSLLINEAIDRLDIDGTPKSLFRPISYTMEGGGKRLRPVLTLAVADALTGDFSVAIPAALAVEMYHNFTLLHDDIMDHSDTRRGRDTVVKRWGEATAILSGDAMLTFAGSIPLQSELPDHVKIALLNCFNQVAMDVYRGQQMDMEFESRSDVTLDEYMEMISLKTAALIAGACLMGAISVEADDRVMHAFFNYGHNLGIAFQLQDDLLDTFGDAASFGKPIGGDILNDKKTWLRIAAMQEAPAEMARVASEGLEGDAKIAAVTDIYRRLNLPARGEEMIRRFTDAAIAHVASLGLDDKATDFFRSFADRLVTRVK